jgi:hypothetical protein
MYDRVSESNDPGPGPLAVLLKRGVVMAAASLDPLATAVTSILPAGTPIAPVPASGLYKPIRRTLANGGCTTSQASVPVTDTTMFAAGDVITRVAAATPGAAAVAVGTISSIVDGVSLELTGNASNAVTSGDIIQVAENDLKEDACILLHDVDLRNASGTAVDTGAQAMVSGQIAKSALNFNTAKGISITRLRAELPMIDFVNATAGTVD